MSSKQYPESLIRNRERLIEKAKQLNLFSDAMAKMVFTDSGACEHVLRILSGIDSLVIKENRTQMVINKFASKDIIMDVLVEDANNKLYEMEIQKSDGKIDHARRMLYYSSSIIGSYLPKGKDKKYKSVPDLYMFYITEPDIWHLGCTCYNVTKRLNNLPMTYDDGLHMYYVNAEVNDGSTIAKLMQYFKTAEADDLSQGKLSKHVNYLKSTKEGKAAMCEFTERIFSEGKAEGRAEGEVSANYAAAKRMLLKGNNSLQDIAEFTNLPLSKIQELQAELKNA